MILSYLIYTYLKQILAEYAYINSVGLEQHASLHSPIDGIIDDLIALENTFYPCSEAVCLFFIFIETMLL